MSEHAAHCPRHPIRICHLKYHDLVPCKCHMSEQEWRAELARQLVELMSDGQ